MGVDAFGSQKRALDPLELELLMVVNFPTRMFGTELRNSKRAV